MDEYKISTIWFTGLSASGKTTLSQNLFNSLIDLSINNVVLLDGEVIRDQLQNYEFDSQSREQVGIQKAQIALEHNQKGKIVLISGIAHKKKWRREIRDKFDNYFEIFLNCNVEKCIERDYKGNYDKAISGSINDFVGISEPYEVSSGYDLMLDTSECSIEFCSQKILQEVLKHLKKQ